MQYNLDSNYISAELELDIDIESLSSDLHADFHLFGNAPCELR
ncbi:11302_t:CDS:2, partial [Rhizophagus irregularis]